MPKASTAKPPDKPSAAAYRTVHPPFRFVVSFLMEISVMAA